MVLPCLSLQAVITYNAIRLHAIGTLRTQEISALVPKGP